MLFIDLVLEVQVGQAPRLNHGQFVSQSKTLKGVLQVIESQEPLFGQSLSVSQLATRVTVPHVCHEILVVISQASKEAFLLHALKFSRLEALRMVLL